MLRRDFIALPLAAAVMGPLWAQNPSPAKPWTCLVLGDSLSAEYGLPRGQGWVALLQARLAQTKSTVQVVNASISGDTTSGGRARLGKLLEHHQPQLVVIELGGNDALRGLPLSMTENNLMAMVRASKAAGARVLLVGMQVPPNYGPDYTRQFTELYAKVARQEKTGLVPFFLKGIADGPQAAQLFQGDRIHPNVQAQGMMLDNLWPELKKLLP